MSASTAVDGKGGAAVKLDDTSAAPPVSSMESKNREGLVQRLRRISLRSTPSRGSSTATKVGSRPPAATSLAEVDHGKGVEEHAASADANVSNAAEAPALPSKDDVAAVAPTQTTSLEAEAIPAIVKDTPQPVDLGAQVLVFTSDQPMADIQAQVDEVYQAQVSNQFGGDRWALFFHPGQYSLDVRVGYYTTVHGLGASPEDVVITGAVRVKADWMENNNATINFWRGVENLTVIPTIEEDASVLVWAVSQGTFFRRIHVKGPLVLSDHGGWSSGGFVADSRVDGQIDNGTQQQFVTRNISMGAWTGGSYAQVFVGDVGAPNEDWPKVPYSTIKKTPVVREKPYLVYDAESKAYLVAKPMTKSCSVGPSWGKDASDNTQDPCVALSSFYVASPTKDTADTINAALIKGLSILFTPGVYLLSSALAVTSPDTILLGLGLATLKPVNGTAALTVADIANVHIAGFLLDAGNFSSSLCTIGDAGSGSLSWAPSDDPTVLSDVFCRVGGAGLGRCDNCITINRRDTIGDNLWLWRADHGSGVGWNLNPCSTGLIVNADYVTIYGLFNEHHKEYQTIWNGDHGQVFFYQSELPYDPPDNAIWSHSRVPGWASYKVSNSVTSHYATGLGIYCVFTNANVFGFSAIEQPASHASYEPKSVLVRHATTVRFGGAANSGIDHVINALGATINDSNKEAQLESAYE